MPKLSNLKNSSRYFMESEEETIRLEIKTDPEALRKQALWCGIKPGMRVLDVGCGTGKTTSLLYEMIQPDGCVVGIDFSETRIFFAKENYGKKKGIEFHLGDFRESMKDLGQFDFIWVRFLLEYYRKEAIDIVKNLKMSVAPGGLLCLLDLDYNCLNHYELPVPLARILPKIMNYADKKYNFDTFVGRKLYSFLYDSGFEKIDVELMAHNLIFGEIKDKDKFNLSKKIEIAAKKAEKLINSYPGGYQQFSSDLNKFLFDPRRFTYTPLLLCKGVKPFSC
ncbi:MAG: class I SAM-dependent methyltransferase [Smithellaceae bacterium]